MDVDGWAWMGVNYIMVCMEVIIIMYVIVCVCIYI